MTDPNRHQRTLGFILKQVTALRPGQRVSVSASLLRDIEPLHHNGYSWTPPDRVLENITGASYEFRYTRELQQRGDVTFERLDWPLRHGDRSYVSPDRRHLYVDIGGLWVPIMKSTR